MSDEVLHTCPNCGNTKISKKAIERCDGCSTSHTIHQMNMGGQVIFTEAPIQKCQWFGCQDYATHRITRASVNVCKTHLKTNINQFGCDLSYEELMPVRFFNKTLDFRFYP